MIFLVLSRFCTNKINVILFFESVNLNNVLLIIIVIHFAVHTHLPLFMKQYELVLVKGSYTLRLEGNCGPGKK